jgi:spore germination cell wall hydrolase CwlJ-like protein
MRKTLLAILLSLCTLHLNATDTELDCLTQNVYQEARGESRNGMIAVALVTLNRAESSTICKAVYAKNQFSWTKTRQRAPRNTVQWGKAKDAAFEAFMNREILGIFQATHFHNKQVHPGWKLTRVATIGNHVFYK